MGLITPEQLEAFMGRNFDDNELAQSEALIETASYMIESITGVSFSLVQDDEIRAQADGYGVIELNAKPVIAVAVYDIDEDVELDYPAWDGLAGIYGLQPNQVVDIVYTHGYTAVPGDIQGVCKSVCARVMYNPSGLRQETVGAISVTYPGIGGEAGTINFSTLEKKVLAKYAATMKSMRMSLARRRLTSLPVLTIDNDIA